MKPWIVRCLSLLAALIAGCAVSSVHPYYQPKDVVQDARLVGTWVADGDEIWTVREGESGSYKVTTRSGQAQEVGYELHLFRLAGQLFADVMPDERHGELVPPHLLVKIVQLEPTLKISLFSGEWLEKYLEKNPRAVRHVVLGRLGDTRRVLTDDPPQVQRFVKRQMKNPEAWGEVGELKRRSDPR